MVETQHEFRLFLVSISLPLAGDECIAESAGWV